MHRRWIAMLLAVPGLAAAQAPAAPIADDALAAFLGPLKVEARLDADVDGDGVVDLAYVASDENERVFGVLSGAGPAARLGERVLAEGHLSATPQAAAVLTFEKNELRIDDITGGDTTTTSSCRYRYDADARRLRVSVMQAETYSASLEHPAVRVHWDALKGLQTLEEGQVVTLDTGEQVYVYGPETRSRRDLAPVYVEQAPQPAALVSQVQAAGRVASAGATHARDTVLSEN